MSLRTPTPGLRSVVNRTNGVVKTSLVIPVGDELLVSDDVAGQLIGARVGLRYGDQVEDATADPKGEPQVEDASATPGRKRNR